MKCNGIDAVSGEHLEISFSNGVIDGVDHLLAAPEERVYIAPGFVDIQVNGFAGVDYNAPDAAQGNIRLVTISPEWPEARGFIERLVREGVVISIGHTKAQAEQIADAVRAGATLSTHIGNGAHSVMKRHPNYIWEQLAEDR